MTYMGIQFQYVNKVNFNFSYFNKPIELNSLRLYLNGTIFFFIRISPNQLNTKHIINIARYGNADNNAFWNLKTRLSENVVGIKDS